jgi:hypothetical protein
MKKTHDKDDFEQTVGEIREDIRHVDDVSVEEYGNDLPMDRGDDTPVAEDSAPTSNEEALADPESPQVGAQVIPTTEAQRQTTQTTFEGVLAEDPQHARDKMLEDAVEAKDVRLFDETGGKWKRWMPVTIVVLILIVLGAVGATLGVVIPRRNKGFETPVPTDLPSEAPSAAPSQAPTTASFAIIAQAVEAAFGTTLKDTSSPQYRAAEWMAEEDQLITSPMDNLTRFAQRYAMVTFYYSTGGDVSWKRQANFLSPDVDICQWQESAPVGADTVLGILGTSCSIQGELSVIEFCK